MLAKIIIRTNVRTNKKSICKEKTNPFNNVIKVSTLIVELDPDYESVVNEQRQKEGNTNKFIAGARIWGSNKGDGTVEHKSQQYVNFIAKETVLNTFFDGTKIISKESLKDFIPAKKPSTKQGVALPVAYRSVKAENIMAVEIL